MLKFFNSNKIILSFFYLVLIGLFAGIDYYFGKELSESPVNTIIAQTILNPYYRLSIEVQYIIATLVVFIQCLLLIYISTKQQILKTTNLLPGLFYILFIALSPSPFLLNEAILANFLVILAINEVLGSYKKNKAYVQVFNAGFFIGSASLLNPVYAILFIWAFIAFIQLRSFKGNERILMVIGLALPYYLLGTFYYYNDELHLLLNNDLLPLLGLWNFKFANLQSIFCFLSGFLIFVALSFNFRRFNYKRSIVVQRKILSLFVLYSIQLLLIIFLGLDVEQYLILLAIPAAIFSSLLSLNAKNKWGELVTLLFLLNILCLRITPIIEMFGLI